MDLPRLALSVRQPWAWAILHGGKVIENRSAGAIRAGGMTLGPVALHAAAGMTEAEYAWGVDRLRRHGTIAPRPEDLPRRCLIGQVEVVDIVSESDSEWFGGPMGLVLERPQACAPIPAPGALGYFEWRASGALAPPAPWMARWNRPSGDARTGELFEDLAPSFRARPERPRRKR
ncbi:MAG: hypothetical protein AAGI51_12585 [Pseudomonadota bacterium]